MKQSLLHWEPVSIDLALVVALLALLDCLLSARGRAVLSSSGVVQ